MRKAPSSPALLTSNYYECEKPGTNMSLADNLLVSRSLQFNPWALNQSVAYLTFQALEEHSEVRVTQYVESSMLSMQRFMLGGLYQRLLRVSRNIVHEFLATCGYLQGFMGNVLIYFLDERH